MDKDKRQKRFQQKERDKKQSRKIAERILSPFSSLKGEKRDEWIERNTGMLHNHGKLCSCHMCGNPRKYFNDPTLQEKKMDEKTKTYLKDDLQ